MRLHGGLAAKAEKDRCRESKPMRASAGFHHELRGYAGRARMLSATFNAPAKAIAPMAGLNKRTSFSAYLYREAKAEAGRGRR
jgi:hypothetical protein